MVFTYRSFFNSISYENIEPLAQIKLIWTYDYENKPIIANYNGNIEYFYAQQLYSDDENFDINEYILSLPIINVDTLEECKEIIDICSNRKMGLLDFYLINKQFMQEYFLTLPTTTTGTSTTTTTTSTTTTNTTTPCPTGVLSRRYYLNATNECAICVETNEFVCSPYENYNYDNCINSINSYNYGNINCSTTTNPIGPQG